MVIGKILLGKFAEVVYLAIEDQGVSAGTIQHWLLRRARQVNDRKTGMAQQQPRGLELTFAIRAPMTNGFKGIPKPFGLFCGEARKTPDTYETAHRLNTQAIKTA
jgi:hypothetical protein